MDFVGATFSRFVSNKVCSVFSFVVVLWRWRCDVCGCDCEVICICIFPYVGGCRGSIVHVKECGGQNRSLWDSIGEISCVR